MQPKQFHIPPAAVAANLRKNLYLTIPILLLAMSIGLFIARNGSHTEGGSDDSVLYFVTPCVLIFLGMGLRSGFRKQRKMQESFVLAIGEGTIRREQLGMPDIELPFSQIKSIIALNNGGYCIRAVQGANTIVVPPGLNNSDELRQLLESIMPMESKGAYNFLNQHPWVLVVVMFFSLGLTFFTSHVLVVTLGGLTMVAFFGWAFYEGRRSKSIDDRTKKSLWWVFVVMAWVLVRVWTIWQQ